MQSWIQVGSEFLREESPFMPTAGETDPFGSFSSEIWALLFLLQTGSSDFFLFKNKQKLRSNILSHGVTVHSGSKEDTK